MKRLGVTSPCIRVAALNPHAGESGAFGDKEIREIASAVDAVRSGGIATTGPHPADTIFVRAMKGEFNGVVFLYHDQGNISMRVAGFGEGVMIYSGLPFSCTGPTHGTAYDIARQGRSRQFLAGRENSLANVALIRNHFSGGTSTRPARPMASSRSGKNGAAVWTVACRTAIRAQ